jgi:nucleoside-diphosphate-sugar epimerase
LRYGHIYGPGEERYEKLIPTVIRNLLANQSPVIYGDGSALRDYLYVGDAVEATIKAALVAGDVGPLNIVRGDSVSLKETVQMLIRLSGSDQKIEWRLDKPNGPSLRFDNRLMTNLLGSGSMVSLEDGLTAEVGAFRRV